MKLTIQSGVDARPFRSLIYEMGMAATGVTVKGVANVGHDRAKLDRRREVLGVGLKLLRGVK